MSEKTVYQGSQGYAQIIGDPQRIADFVNQKVASKVRWFRENRHLYEGRTWPCWQDKVLEIFYRDNLSIQVPRDGDVVCKAGRLLIVDWRTPCPILDTCVEKREDTDQVCSVLYHVQYQVLLSLIDPRLVFARDYSQLRPGASHCREVIFCAEDAAVRC